MSLLGTSRHSLCKHKLAAKDVYSGVDTADAQPSAQGSTYLLDHAINGAHGLGLECLLFVKGDRNDMQQFAIRLKVLIASGLVTLFLVGLLYSSNPSLPTKYFEPWSQSYKQGVASILSEAEAITASPPPDSAFGDRGRLSEKLASWIDQTRSHGFWASDRKVQQALEVAVTTLYPFLIHSQHVEDETPFASLRQRYAPGSRGICISVGRSHFRYAVHLIANLRDVLDSSLPIEIAYAGEDDLPESQRAILQSLSSNISFLDVLSVFGDETLDLANGGWAVKSFAIIASRFEQVIMMDADSVFLQRPEVILDDHAGYKSTGALLFHDRLLWQNVFKDRTKWWHELMNGRVPSAALNSSKVWMENYAEEGDSGVVVVDKRPTRTMLGLLHIAWQNSKAVRDEWTYKITYGDKESWWLGLELCGVPFAFEEHYGGVLGELASGQGQSANICGFSIAHLDELQRLLWFNGSLLKNKAVNATNYWVPSHYMVEGTWAKGATKADMSCMSRGIPHEVDAQALSVLERSVERATELDVQYAEYMT